MRTWIYALNTFLTVTENSYEICKKIIAFTLNVIASSASGGAQPFTDIEASLRPAVDNFDAQYLDWTQQKGTQKGSTTSLAILLATLSGQKARRWDIKVQGLYDVGTPEYTAIFPNRRTPFQNGKQQNRIEAVGALGQALNGIVDLAELKTEVDAFHQSLLDSYNAQKAELGDTKIDSDAVDAARIAVCKEMYSALGLLMSHFKERPADLQAYFDLETIRNHEQTSFTHNINGGETRLAITHTFADGEEVRLINEGNTALKYALCAEANDAITTPFVEVAALEETVVPASTLGNLTNRFLKVENLDATEKGRYTIMLL